MQTMRFSFCFTISGYMLMYDCVVKMATSRIKGHMLLLSVNAFHVVIIFTYKSIM